jgi:cell wall assembly regulator SMI1
VLAMKYGKYIMFVRNKTTDKEIGKSDHYYVAFFTANDKETIYEMIAKSNYRKVEKYNYTLDKIEIGAIV